MSLPPDRPRRLPPERRLPDPERMLSDILDGEATPSAVRHRSPLLLVAAVGIGIVLVLGAGWFINGVRTTTVNPAGSAAGTAGPSSRSSAASSPPPTDSSGGPTGSAGPSAELLQIGDTASFTHFQATVLDTRFDGDFYLVRARSCVRELPANPQGDRTRVSQDPWVLVAGRSEIPASASGPDNLSDRFPREQLLRVGECSTGWIPFEASRSADLTAVVYANFVGEQAGWQIR